VSLGSGIARSTAPDRRLVWVVLVILVALASPTGSASQATPTKVDAPEPVTFPRDDGRHDSAIEWWYFTGHLFARGGDRYGFEFVIFRARNGDLEGYVSHFAITDNRQMEFQYDQRLVGGAGVAGSAATLDLDVNGWTMRGGGGQFALAAQMPGYAMRIDVETTKPPALHDGDGYIDYGNGAASYYYSWTRMDVSGTLDLGGGELPVTGEAWMDHQWGDFETYQDGGWDWFSLQLADGQDVMLYLIRAGDGTTLRVDGSIVDSAGRLTTLSEGAFTVRAEGEWTSLESGTTYPQSWTIEIPSHDLTLSVAPSLPDQELDTRATTGVIYWEGEVLVEATTDDRTAGGYGYVELTGYADYVPLELATPLETPAG
jgi:predicted secreted hydrolase